MKASARNDLEQRLLILAPVGKDATLMEATLRHEDVPSLICRDLDQLIDEISHGAAAVLVAEEALDEQLDVLARALTGQPAWSDLPVLLLTRPGANSRVVEASMQSLGNVTLIERPVRVSALASTVRATMRARARQYQIRAHLEERDRADRAKDEFIATLAHELRNPLAPIRSSLDYLHLNGVAPERQEILDTVERQVSHLTRLVDDLMDVSRVTRGKVELRKEPVRLAQVITAAVDISRPQIDQARQALTVHMPRQAIAIEADPMRLAQVFSNLLNNAAKYSEPGGRIELAVRVDPDHAIVSVTDTGFGIAADALPRVFEMFFQANGNGRPLGGLGIGLTLSRSIVEMHGGTIAVTSKGLGQGSCFVVTLPLARRTAAPAREPQPQVTVSGTPRVLVVDDNKDAARSLALLLEQLGADVRVAHDGEAALEAVKDFRPEAAFLDIGMPGMDGYEVASRIRARRNARSPLLVALTGWSQSQDRMRTRAAGFQHHMVKPADVGDLRQVLASIAH